MPKHKRRIKLIKPRLQLKLTGWFLSVTVMGLLMQYLLFGFFLTQLTSELPSQGGYLMGRADSMLLKALGFSFLLVLPLSLAVGVLVTFRVAGPVYRFEQHLGSLARGEDPGACRIRKGDELHELCARINAAVTTLRTVPGDKEPAQASGTVETPAQPQASLPRPSGAEVGGPA